MKTQTQLDFLDSRKHNFLRTAVIVPLVHLSNPAANVLSHYKEIKQAYNKGACYILGTELGLTGYSNGDYFFDETLLQAGLESLKTLMRKTKRMNAVISVGLPLRFNGMLFNCAVTFYHNKILAVTPKLYPPNYREFYEGRHFASGLEAWWKTVDLLGQRDIAFGWQILIKSAVMPDFVLHVFVCEDGWLPVTPGSFAELAGATISANMSASNITIDKDEYREKLFVGDSGRGNSAYLYAAAGFGESTSDLSWDGDAFIAERGTLLKRTEPFLMTGTHVISDIDLTVLINERVRQTSWHQNAAHHKTTLAEFRTVFIEGTLGTIDGSVYQRIERDINPHPFVPQDETKRNKRCWQVFNMQATSLARRLKSRPEKFRKVVIAVSGGRDSTHALLIAAHAMDLLGLPRTNIIAITMPGFGTTDGTRKDAIALIKAVGATYYKIDIKKQANGMFHAIGYDPKSKGNRVVFENVQAWTRIQVAFALAAKLDALVLGTGTLSELLLGWCTMFGDHASHYGINVGLPKTLEKYMITWAKDVIFAREPKVQKVLQSIIDRVISPELELPNEQGLIAQATEELIGPYELHDFFGCYFVRFGLTPSRIARMAWQAFAGKYTIGEIKHWLQVFMTRFIYQQYKRNCLPDGPKIGLVAVSPRGDLRLPADAEADIWLSELATIPNRLRVRRI
jgi:NAD+ synthase (glutamine-hydrolysing)